MMPATTVGRWGKSLAIRIPDQIALAAKLAAGDQVQIETISDQIIVRQSVPRFTAATLFAGRSSADWRAEYANAYDWGPDLGREDVAE